MSYVQRLTLGAVAVASAIGIGALLVLASCSAPAVNKALASAPGQLFCHIETAGGGSLVAGLLAATVAGAAPGLAPIVVIATNSGQAAVNNDCANAAATYAASLGTTATGAPVSPPIVAAGASVPQIAIVAPKSNTAPASS